MPASSHVLQPLCPHIAPLLLSCTNISNFRDHVTSDFMQLNPFSRSAAAAPTFVTPIIPPMYGSSVPSALFWGGPLHATQFFSSLDSTDLIKQFAEAITSKKNDTLPEWKLPRYNSDPLWYLEWLLVTYQYT